jgi:hypothetical protein
MFHEHFPCQPRTISTKQKEVRTCRMLSGVSLTSRRGNVNISTIAGDISDGEHQKSNSSQRSSFIEAETFCAFDIRHIGHEIASGWAGRVENSASLNS